MEGFRNAVMVVGVTALLCLAVFAMAWAWVRVATPIIMKMRQRKIDTLLVLPFIVCCVYVGSTKVTGKVTFPYTDVEKRYLFDAGSYVTNDYVHVAWTRSPIVPSSAEFYGAARLVGNTNDNDWVVFLSGNFETITSPTNVPYSGAGTNNFQFFTTWTPGPSVHTNGVAFIVWQTGSSNSSNLLVTYRTGIYTNGFRVAPSAGITNGPPIEATITTGE